MISCPACGYTASETDGPTHAYMSPSAPCWAMYGEVLAREFSDTAYYQSHRLLTDAYCAHHSIADGRRARQSINIHLAGLMLYFEDNAKGPHIVRFLKSAATRADFPQLLAPTPDGTITIKDIHTAKDADTHAIEVRKYARKVFAFWQHEHPRIRDLINEVSK